jgi:hypothetical protein
MSGATTLIRVIVCLRGLLVIFLFLPMRERYFIEGSVDLIMPLRLSSAAAIAGRYVFPTKNEKTYSAV